MAGEFERLMDNLHALQRAEPILQKAVSRQLRMNQELSDLWAKDEWRRIVRRAERLKASVDAQRKPPVTFAKAEPISLDEAQARLAKAAAAGAPAEQVARVEAQIHAIERSDSLMKAVRSGPSIHNVIRSGDWGALPAAPFQRAVAR
jgi:hypothetical protein